MNGENETEAYNQTLYSESNPPPSYHEASARRTFLTNKTTDIDVQVQARDAEYRQWRERALMAKTFAAREIVFIKGWVLEKSDVVMLSETEIVEADPISLLREAYKTLRIIEQGEGKLPGRDRALLAAMARHVL